MSNPFWINQPAILLNKNNINEIWPTKDMDINQKLNAITRLIIIITLLFYLITNNVKIIITGVATIIAIIILKILKDANNNKKKENKAKKEGFASLDKSMLDKLNYQRPKKENPLMNVLTTGKDQDRPPAAPAFNPVVEDEINKATQAMVIDNFNDKEGIDERLFQDLGDNFLFNRSMIQFNSNPNTQIPNDQESFAEFCYGDMISCKEGNPLACTQGSPPHWINGNQ